MAARQAGREDQTATSEDLPASHQQSQPPVAREAAAPPVAREAATPPRRARRAHRQLRSQWHHAASAGDEGASGDSIEADPVYTPDGMLIVPAHNPWRALGLTTLSAPPHQGGFVYPTLVGNVFPSMDNPAPFGYYQPAALGWPGATDGHYALVPTPLPAVHAFFPPQPEYVPVMYPGQLPHSGALAHPHAPRMLPPHAGASPELEPDSRGDGELPAQHEWGATHPRLGGPVQRGRRRSSAAASRAMFSPKRGALPEPPPCPLCGSKGHAVWECPSPTISADALAEMVSAHSNIGPDPEYATMVTYAKRAGWIKKLKLHKYTAALVGKGRAWVRSVTHDDLVQLGLARGAATRFLDKRAETLGVWAPLEPCDTPGAEEPSDDGATRLAADACAAEGPDP